MILQCLKNGKNWIGFLYEKYAEMDRPDLVKLLQYASLERHGSGSGEHRRWVLILWVRIREWDEIRTLSERLLTRHLKAIASLHDADDVRVRMYSVSAEENEEPWRPIIDDEELTTVGLNNCFFKAAKTIEHDELRFRSPAELPIYDELKKRKLIFFPNAAAVFGDAGRLKKEPDFLICCKGKWGILEVMGNKHHNETTAVKDHERARLFKEHGIKCIEFFQASKCLSNPSTVVDEFLNLLVRY